MPIYRRLIAWQAAMDLADAVYDLTAQFPQREQFALAKQVCSAAISVPSNIADGRGRRSRRDFCHFLAQARGSLYELETQISFAQRRGKQSVRVLMLINGLIRRFDPDPRLPIPDLR